MTIAVPVSVKPDASCAVDVFAEEDGLVKVLFVIDTGKGEVISDPEGSGVETI